MDCWGGDGGDSDFFICTGLDMYHLLVCGRWGGVGGLVSGHLLSEWFHSGVGLLTCDGCAPESSAHELPSQVSVSISCCEAVLM